MSMQAFYNSGFPTLAPGTLPSPCMLVPSFSPRFFLPPFPSPRGVCGQLALPQWGGGVLGVRPDGVRSLSVGPSHLARRASRPEPDSWEGCVLGPGELLYPFNTGAVEKGERFFFFLLRSCHLVLQTYTRSICCCFRNNTEIVCHPTYSAFICKHTVQNLDL